MGNKVTDASKDSVCFDQTNLSDDNSVSVTNLTILRDVMDQTFVTIKPDESVASVAQMNCWRRCIQILTRLRIALFTGVYILTPKSNRPACTPTSTYGEFRLLKTRK